jgi:hypothetical protein
MFSRGAFAMMTPLKLLNIRNKPPTHLDDHLLRDLGISRIDSEFAPQAPFAFKEDARTCLEGAEARLDDLFE